MKHLNPSAARARRRGRPQRAYVRLLLWTLICASVLALLRIGPRAIRAQAAPSADLVVTKSGDDTAPLGGQITYSIVVNNSGPDDAANVVLTDPIPAHTTFVNASASQGTAMFDGTTVTANFGTITAFNGASLTLVVSVNNDTPRGTTISNTATATSDTPDPDPSTNSATANTFVTGPFPGDVLISEFRFRGPTPSSTTTTSTLAVTGASDEFIELYNNTDVDIVVSDSLGSNGWALVSSDDTGTSKFVVPNGTTIPARGHFLGVNANGYSLNGYPAGTTINAVGDVTYTADIPNNAGIALFKTADPAGFDANHRLDAVGFSAVIDPLYREGNGLGVPVTTDVEHSFVRKLTSGFPQDTDNNLADFVLVATDGNQTLASAQLGAPGPENLNSPIQHNIDIKSSLIEPTQSSFAPPNRVRTGSGDSGTLSIRRRFTNNTGATVTRLRFRAVNITTQNTPVSVAPQADLRLITSGDFTITTSLGDLMVQGTVLEEPPAQPQGGGLNSSVTAFVPGGGLAPGATIDVQFLLNIVKSGNYRIFVNVEALTETSAPTLIRGPNRHKLATRSQTLKTAGRN
ncbi:MAG: hypothetical protein DMF64_13060 [Acidobacteria bacterium]|nr:MAG: hypothetical protein DMF64_13060 [Acidobacteriota bacterium]